MTAGPRVGLVLGAAVWRSGPSPALRRRAAAAAAAWHAGQVDILIGCGGSDGTAPTEGSAIRELLLAAGVPDEAIRLEEHSRSTEENIAFALPLLRTLGARRVELISDPLHLPRARLIARRLGLEDPGAIPAKRPGLRPGRLLFALREAGAYLVYALRLR